MEDIREDIYLTEPNINLEKEYCDMLAEWENTGERIIPWVLRIDRTDFPRLVESLLLMSNTACLNGNTVPGSTFWLMKNDGKMLGASNVRFTLNEELSNRGGNIGYGIRPSERGKGYATALLRLSLRELRRHGINKALITCDHDNYASERVIIKNGGISDSVFENDGVIIKRYWISLL